MLERHENEQYFFDDDTVRRLADIAQQFPNPCCLCAPRVGEELEKRGVRVVNLDSDARFDYLTGYRPFDLFRPKWQGDEFGVIMCDPPFFKVSLSQLFSSIRLLSRHDYSQKVMICYLTRRGANLMGTFHQFGLVPTGFHPGYRTVRNVDRNEIEFFANFELNERANS